MKIDDIGLTIAERELDLRGGGTVTVVIGKPQKFPEGVDYYCPYRISGLGSGKIRYAGGIDAVQALELTLKMIGADLYTSSEAQAGSLTWHDNANLGFPVPDSISDIAPR